MTPDMSSWPLKPEKVLDLQLDPKNPRIPGTQADAKQRELIAELVLHDDAYELAKGIASNGYYPNEVVVAFRDAHDKQLYVVEGNRRIAALKCLLSPEAAPESHKKHFEKLSASINRKQIEKIYTLICPNRQSAIPLLLDRHTHQQIHSWSRPMQARFIQRLADDGMTIEQIAAWSNKTAAETRKLLVANALYSAACSLALPPEVMEKVHNPRTFPLSTIERIFESKAMCDFLGVEKDATHFLKGNVKKSEFVPAFEKIITDTATGQINTRSLNDAADVKKYQKTFGKAKPDLSLNGRFALTQLTKPDPQPAKAASPPQPKPKTPRASLSVIPVVVKCGCENKRIRDVFSELKRMPVAKHPNATALLLRTLIDLCVSNYLVKSGQMKALLALPKYAGRGKGWSPSLRQMIDHLLTQVDCGLEGAAHAAIQTFTTSRRDTLCLDGLDKFTHNQYVMPDEETLRNVWTNVEPLMMLVLTDPS